MSQNLIINEAANASRKKRKHVKGPDEENVFSATNCPSYKSYAQANTIRYILYKLIPLYKNMMQRKNLKTMF